MHLLIIIITLFTLGVLYFIDTRENFKSEIVIPPQPEKRPPTPYLPYIRFGDKRKTFFVAPK